MLRAQGVIAWDAGITRRRVWLGSRAHEKRLPMMSRRAVLVAVVVALLVAGCGSEETATTISGIDTTVVTVHELREIVTGDAGAAVDVPAGLAAEYEITVDPIASLDGLPPTGDPEAFAGGIVLQPHGLVFDEPVVITIPLIREVASGRQLRLYYWDGVGDVWEETGFTAVVAADGMSASGEVAHFSYYVLQPSGIDAEEDGIFGDVEGTVIEKTLGGDDLATVTQAVFDGAISHANARFPFGSPRPFDIPAFNGYNCYETVGRFFLFDHGSEGLETPLTVTIGDINDVEFRIDYIREVDVTVKDRGVEHEVFGTLVVNVYWRSRPPLIDVVGSRTAMWAGDSATVSATLTCGEHPMRDIEVDFSISTPQPLVGLSEELGFTGSDGRADTVVETAEGASGIVTVQAEHLWTDLDGDISAGISDFVHISMGGVSGTWQVTGNETWSGCTDPIDNGVYAGSAEVFFSQLGDTFTGFGDFPRTSELIVGTVARTGPATFTMTGTTNYVEDWDGWTVTGTSEFTGLGSIERGTIDFTWSGRDQTGDTCSFSGEGQATRP